MSDTEVPKLDKIGTAKTVARFVVSASVRFVVTSAITTLVPTETKTQQVKVAIAGYVIGSLVADKAKSFISDEITDMHEAVTEFRAKNKEDTEIDIPVPV